MLKLNKNNNGGFFLGALFGAAIAGATALLYAPKSGKELRDDLYGEFDHLMDRASDYSDYAVERGVEMYDAAAEATEDIKVNLKESGSKLKTQMTDLSKEASDEWAKVKSELEQSKSNIQDEAKDLADTVADEATHLADETKEAVDEVKDRA